MEFTFDVWKTPLISRRVASMQTLSQSMSDDSAQSTMSSDDSSMSTDPTETSDRQLATNNIQKIVPSGWRKPELSQKRTRERLLKVFHSLGPGSVDLSRTPSVLFSSTSIDRETTTGSGEGSGEPITIEPDPHGEGTVDSIFKFLYPEDAADPFSDLYNQEKVDRDDDEDDNEIDAMVEPMDDPDTEIKQEDLDEDQPHSPTDSTKSSQDDDTISTLSLTPEHSSFAYIAVDEVEDAWRRHADEVVKDTNGHEAIQTFHVFAHLYNVMQQRFCNLTREGCNYLGDKMRGVAQEFLQTLDLLSKYTVCPFVFVDTEVLVEGGLLQKHQQTVMELDQHYDTYITKRDSTHKCLDDIKSSLKRQSVASQELIHINSQVELCRQLYKLYSQLRMLFDTYCKLVNSTRDYVTAQITDFSKEVAMAKMELGHAAEDIDRNMGSFSPNIDASQTRREDARRALRTEMGNQSFATALRMLHAYRSMWTGQMFGSGEEDDEDVLLHLFCEHLAEGKTGVRAISTSAEGLAGICSRLLEVNMQLMTATKSIEMLEIQEVTEKHESEPCEGQEEYGRGVKHLKGSSENVEDTETKGQPLAVPNGEAVEASDTRSDTGSEASDSSVIDLEGATLTSSTDHQRSPSSGINHAVIVNASGINQAVIVNVDPEEEAGHEKEESSIASDDDTVKANSVTDEVDFDLLASLKEESVDELLDVPYNPSPTLDLSSLSEVSEEAGTSPDDMPVIELLTDTDNEEGSGDGMSVEVQAEEVEEVHVDQEEDNVFIEEQEGVSVDGEDEVIWQRQSSPLEADDLSTDL